MKDLEISFYCLIFAFLPHIIMIYLLRGNSEQFKDSVMGTFRMIFQLLLMGYILIFLFSIDNSLSAILLLLFMLGLSAWIGMRPLKNKGKKIFSFFFLSLFLGCIPVLFVVLMFVLNMRPWFEGRFMIPIAGMIFSNAFNALSLCAERIETSVDSQNEKGYLDQGLKASLIPQLNSLYSVGLVAIPGMMTGQILAGVSPLIAVRYQILVMTMLFSSTGFSVLIFLSLIKKDNKNQEQSWLALIERKKSM